MRKEIKPIFFLGKKVNHQGKRVVHCRLRINGVKSEFITDIYVNPDDWNPEFKRVAHDFAANSQLSKLEFRLQEIVERLHFNNRTVTAKLVVRLYKGEDFFYSTISEFFKYYLHEKGNVKIFSKSYTDKFITLEKHLRNFTETRYNTSDFRIQSVDYKFISDFDVFLKSIISKQYNKPFSPVYINKIHSMFRTILISAYNEGVIKFQPYQDFRIRKVKTEIKYLSASELERIKTLDVSDNPSLEKVKDIFLFSVYTGLRFKDAQEITKYDIEYENGEPKFLITIQKKTNDKVEIPILRPTLELIRKYEDNAFRKETGKLMPQISNVKLNAYLKVIGDLANIRLKLTHHVARHTCATTVLLHNDVPLNEVSKWLGHADLSSTRVYAKITREKLGNTASRLNGIL